MSDTRIQKMSLLEYLLKFKQAVRLLRYGFLFLPYYFDSLFYFYLLLRTVRSDLFETKSQPMG